MTQIINAIGIKVACKNKANIMHDKHEIYAGMFICKYNFVFPSSKF